MDNSETYIKMSEKAEEIQTSKTVWERGDWYYSEGYGIEVIPVNSVEYAQRPNFIWLPRQDQLQEMLPEYSHFGLLGAFYDFVFCPPDEDRIMGDEAKYVEEYPKQFTSMEQLWLAFVMKEKFNKVWDGETWRH